MNLADQHRIAPRHLERSAIVYVRQSTRLQRGLREIAISLGWLDPVLIEDDQGVTASGFADRAGFQWLLTQITQRKVGIILCIEASRLSRNSRDWAHLFELCGYFDTLVADLQQVYDVSIPNDRLVLQIKGTVAELGAWRRWRREPQAHMGPGPAGSQLAHLPQHHGPSSSTERKDRDDDRNDDEDMPLGRHRGNREGSSLRFLRDVHSFGSSNSPRNASTSAMNSRSWAAICAKPIAAATAVSRGSMLAIASSKKLTRSSVTKSAPATSAASCASSRRASDA